MLENILDKVPKYLLNKMPVILPNNTLEDIQNKMPD